MVAGYVVRITIQPVAGHPPRYELFHVAISDPQNAIAAVMTAKSTTPDEKIEIIGSLSARDVKAFGLTPGQIRAR